jgi:hypothetical protein
MPSGAGFRLARTKREHGQVSDSDAFRSANGLLMNTWPSNRPVGVDALLTTRRAPSALLRRSPRIG